MSQTKVSYKPSDEVDFLIVGSGAAGGVLAKELPPMVSALSSSSKGRTSPRRISFTMNSKFLASIY